MIKTILERMKSYNLDHLTEVEIYPELTDAEPITPRANFPNLLTTADNAQFPPLPQDEIDLILALVQSRMRYGKTNLLKNFYMKFNARYGNRGQVICVRKLEDVQTLWDRTKKACLMMIDDSQTHAGSRWGAMSKSRERDANLLHQMAHEWEAQTGNKNGILIVVYVAHEPQGLDKILRAAQIFYFKSIPTTKADKTLIIDMIGNYAYTKLQLMDYYIFRRKLKKMKSMSVVYIPSSDEVGQYYARYIPDSELFLDFLDSKPQTESTPTPQEVNINVKGIVQKHMRNNKLKRHATWYWKNKKAPKSERVTQKQLKNEEGCTQSNISTGVISYQNYLNEYIGNKVWPPIFIAHMEADGWKTISVGKSGQADWVGMKDRVIRIYQLKCFIEWKITRKQMRPEISLSNSSLHKDSELWYAAFNLIDEEYYTDKVDKKNVPDPIYFRQN